MLILDAGERNRGRQHRDAERRPLVGLRDDRPTVGCGAQYPVTLPGRIIGIFLLTAGVALFSVFTAPSPTRFSLPGAAPCNACAAIGGTDRSRMWMRSAGSWSSRTTRSRELKTRLDGLERALVGAPRRRRRGHRVERGPDAGAVHARISAGNRLFRRASGGLKVLLGHPGEPFFAGRDLGYWSIPKGEVAQGGHYVEARAGVRRGDRARPPTRRRPRRSPSGASSRRRQDRPRLGIGGRPGPAAAVSNTFSMRGPPLDGAITAFPRSTASRGSAPRRRAVGSRRRRRRSSTASRVALRST